MSSSQPSAAPAALPADGELARGGHLRSANGLYRLEHQPDGDVVLYSFDGDAVWGTGTSGASTSRLAMQADGNLALFDRQKRPVWTSKTGGCGADSALLRNNGEVVLVKTCTGAVCASLTVPHALRDHLDPLDVLRPGDALSSESSNFVLTHRKDGDVRLYGPTGATLWSTDTAGKRTSLLRLQDDGNVVLYSRTRQPLWSTMTTGSGGKRLQLQKDGKVVLCAGPQVAWRTSVG